MAPYILVDMDPLPTYLLVSVYFDLKVMEITQKRRELWVEVFLAENNTFCRMVKFWLWIAGQTLSNDGHSLDSESESAQVRYPEIKFYIFFKKWIISVANTC